MAGMARIDRSTMDTLAENEWKLAGIYATWLIGKWEQVCKWAGEVR